jgi:ribonuclease G
VNYDLVVSSKGSGVEIALLRDKQLIEFHQDDGSASYQVGDLYFGRIQRTMPGLNAAFINIGHKKDGFLHYLDLGPQVKSLLRFTELVRSGKMKNYSLHNFKPEGDIQKDGKIADMLKTGTQMLVQVAKEPISTKGPRVTSEISLAGKYMVLVPFGNTVSISQKLKVNAERNRLKKILNEIRPKNFSVILRTAAEGKTVEQLQEDLDELFERWKGMVADMKDVKPPKKVLGELSRTSTMIRDMLSSEFNAIHVDSPELFESLKKYLGEEKKNVLKMYKGKGPMFEHFGINRQVKQAFGKNVTFKNGAYLVIEHTEALHVIDVNSGPRTDKGKNQEENALEINIEAAREVARQLRLRDMGGIIVVDFIDLQKVENRKALANFLKDEMKTDKAKHHILPPSKFGLIQITRQRVRPEVDIKTKEKCPSCKGTGEVEATVLLDQEIKNNLDYVLQEQGSNNITLQVHPFVGAYLNEGLIPMKWRYKFKYNKNIKLETSTECGFLEYHMFDNGGEEIRFK